MNRHAWFAPVLLASTLYAQRQLPPELRDLVEQRLEALAEDLAEGDELDLADLVERLEDMLSTPLDLNRTTPERLASLHLLGDDRIGALFDHLARNGPLLRLEELQTIDGFDTRTIRLLAPFVRIAPDAAPVQPSWRTVLREGRHEWTTRARITLQQRRGGLGGPDPFGMPYRAAPGSSWPSAGNTAAVDSLRRAGRLYTGDPWKLYTRYRFRYRDNLSIGFTAEKDEGEAFRTGHGPAVFDFHSAHLFLRGIGRLKALAIGDFQAQFGQGLVFWSGLAFGARSARSVNVKRNAAGLQPYTSVNENLFLRGAGTTWAITRHLDISLLGSHKGIDANIASMDNTNGTLAEAPAEAAFSAFLEDGFHRTPTELARRKAVQETIAAAHLRYTRTRWSLGATAATVHYDHALLPDARPYRLHAMQGRSNTTAGVDWNVTRRNINWSGELARSSSGGNAFTTNLIVVLDRRFTLAMVHRDLSPRFRNTHAVAFGEASDPWNERGTYLGAEWRPERRWTVNAYMDRFRFPWLRYLTDAPSAGTDLLGMVTWTPHKRAQLHLRVRQRIRQRNGERTHGTTPLVEREHTGIRFHASYRVSASIELRTRVEQVLFRVSEREDAGGFLIYQDLMHRPLMGRVELTGRFALFATDSYDARIHAFENDVVGQYSIPPYHGRGIRWYAMVRYAAARGVDIWLHHGTWLYTDRDRIGSGLQEIPGNRRDDLKMQVRVRF